MCAMTDRIRPSHSAGHSGMFATGVTVITALKGEQVHGMTANAFMSVSLEPPLVLISVDRRTKMCGLLHEGMHYGVSVLCETQAALSDRFAGRPGQDLPSRASRSCARRRSWTARSRTSSPGWRSRTGAAITRCSSAGWSTRARTPARRCCSTAAVTRSSVRPLMARDRRRSRRRFGRRQDHHHPRSHERDRRRHVTHISADDYHRYDRKQRRELGVTPLHPDSNHLDILTQHLSHLRRGEPVLKPVYSHRTGEFEPPVYVRPAKFLLVEGLLNFHTETLRSPPRRARRADAAGGAAARVEGEARLHSARIHHRRGAGRAGRPAGGRRGVRAAAAPVSPTSSWPSREQLGGSRHLDADVILRDTLPHPDLSPLLDGNGPALIKREREWLLRIPGNLDPAHAAELEEAVWQRMSFASHLRIRRLGEFTVGTDLHRSDSLALVQLLILYHVVTARAALAIGGSPPRADPRFPTGADSALHA